MEDENGETRSDRNERMGFGHKTPDLEIPEEIKYFLEWYYECSSFYLRVNDGVCSPIKPSEFLDWATLTGELVRTHEFLILHEMDLAFCEETNKELETLRQIAKEKAQGET